MSFLSNRLFQWGQHLPEDQLVFIYPVQHRSHCEVIKRYIHPSHGQHRQNIYINEAIAKSTKGIVKSAIVTLLLTNMYYSTFLFKSLNLTSILN